jgi:inhibitor of KinA sporulation pathway (predicted exonuclease)
MDMNFLINQDSPFREPIRVHALKIRTDNYKVIDTFHMYIKPLLNSKISKNVTTKTGITNNHIVNFGISYKNFMKRFYNFSIDNNKMIDIYSYDDCYSVLLESMNIHNFPENSKFRSPLWRKKFNDLRPIIRMFGFDTNNYTSKNIYHAINSRFKFKEMNIVDNKKKIRDITWNLYHLYVALKKMYKIK